MKRKLSMSVVPGEPTDGSGKICIHLFVQDRAGPFIEPHVLHQGEGGQVVSKPTRGRLACDGKRQVRTVTKNGVTTITHRSDDPRAVTCPGCLASKFYADMMAKLTTGVVPVQTTAGEVTE